MDNKDIWTRLSRPTRIDLVNLGLVKPFLTLHEQACLDRISTTWKKRNTSLICLNLLFSSKDKSLDMLVDKCLFNKWIHRLALHRVQRIQIDCQDAKAGYWPDHILQDLLLHLKSLDTLILWTHHKKTGVQYDEAFAAQLSSVLQHPRLSHVELLGDVFRLSEHQPILASAICNPLAHRSKEPLWKTFQCDALLSTQNVQAVMNPNSCLASVQTLALSLSRLDWDTWIALLHSDRHSLKHLVLSIQSWDGRYLFQFDDDVCALLSQRSPKLVNFSLQGTSETKLGGYLTVDGLHQLAKLSQMENFVIHVPPKWGLFCVNTQAVVHLLRSWPKLRDLCLPPWEDGAMDESIAQALIETCPDISSVDIHPGPDGALLAPWATKLLQACPKLIHLNGSMVLDKIGVGLMHKRPMQDDVFPIVFCDVMDEKQDLIPWLERPTPRIVINWMEDGHAGRLTVSSAFFNACPNTMLQIYLSGHFRDLSGKPPMYSIFFPLLAVVYRQSDT